MYLRSDVFAPLQRARHRPVVLPTPPFSGEKGESHRRISVSGVPGRRASTVSIERRIGLRRDLQAAVAPALLFSRFCRATSRNRACRRAIQTATERDSILSHLAMIAPLLDDPGSERTPPRIPPSRIRQQRAPSTAAASNFSISLVMAFTTSRRANCYMPPSFLPAPSIARKLLEVKSGTGMRSVWPSAPCPQLSAHRVSPPPARLCASCQVSFTPEVTARKAGALRDRDTARRDLEDVPGSLQKRP